MNKQRNKTTKDLAIVLLAGLLVFSLCSCKGAVAGNAAKNSSEASFTESLSPEANNRISEYANLSEESSSEAEQVPMTGDNPGTAATSNRKSTSNSNSKTSNSGQSSSSADNQTSSEVIPEPENYTPRPKNPEVLNNEQTEKIKSDFVTFLQSGQKIPGQLMHYLYMGKSLEELTPSDVNILRYFGTYNGCEALFIHASDEFRSLTATSSIEVAGYKFGFWNCNEPFFIHVNDTYMNVETAYDNGWITKEDVRDLQWHFNNEYYNR